MNWGFFGNPRGIPMNQPGFNGMIRGFETLRQMFHSWCSIPKTWPIGGCLDDLVPVWITGSDRKKVAFFLKNKGYPQSSSILARLSRSKPAIFAVLRVPPILRNLQI